MRIEIKTENQIFISFTHKNKIYYLYRIFVNEWKKFLFNSDIGPYYMHVNIIKN